MRKALEFGFCVVGIYACFLTWGVIQERLSTVDYSAPFNSISPTDGAGFAAYFSWYYGVFMLWVHRVFLYFLSFLYEPEILSELASPKFESFILLNMVQSIGSVVISFWLLRFLEGDFPVWTSFSDGQRFLEKYLPDFYRKSSGGMRKRSFGVAHKYYNQGNIYLKVPSSGSSKEQTSESLELYSKLDKKPKVMPLDLFLQYVRLALCFCFASPFGYASLKYIDYVAMNLGKSCKLLPLVIISIFFRGKKIDSAKLLSLILITTGVTGFMLFDGKKAKHQSDSINNQSEWTANLYGLFLLLINLTLDGAMNTFQDEMFSQYRISSFHMMFHMNWLSVLFMMFYLLSPLTGELWRTLDSLILFPRLFADVSLFGLCGALGQAFVFYTIEKFGALSLVTVTVTRKLFTILLSVVYFGHALNFMQWVSVGVVFAALLLETFSKHKKRIVPVALLPEGTSLGSDSSLSSFDLALKRA